MVGILKMTEFVVSQAISKHPPESLKEIQQPKHLNKQNNNLTKQEKQYIEMSPSCKRQCFKLYQIRYSNSSEYLLVYHSTV